MIDPVSQKDRNRVVPENDKFKGTTQLCKGGRCWQMPGVGEEVEDALRAHIKEQGL